MAYSERTEGSPKGQCKNATKYNEYSLGSKRECRGEQKYKLALTPQQPSPPLSPSVIYPPLYFVLGPTSMW